MSKNHKAHLAARLPLPLVVAQLSLIAGILYPQGTASIHQIVVLNLVALLLVLAAAGIALWALYSMRLPTFTVMPTPAPGGSLCTSGPYALVRHPMYSAIVFGCLGCCLYFQNPVKWISLIALFAVLIAKLTLEEMLLQEKYPGYSTYQKKTARLLPGIY